MPNTMHVIDGSGVVAFRATWNEPEVVEEVLRRLSRGGALDGLPAAGPHTSREVYERVLEWAGPRAAREFAPVRHAVRDPVELPGGHVGCVTRPAEFARELVQALV